MRKLESILLIDDNANDNYYHLLTIRETVASKQIKTVKNGSEAIAYLEEGKNDPSRTPYPDLVFLDISMPEMDGFEFLEHIREKHLFFDDKPIIIIMSNHLTEENEGRAKEGFANEIVDFISKPLTEEVLKGIIAKYFK